ncbi:MAG: septum formation initiator family protein [Acidimicrobiia bacterium]|nr:septum formation initiator family protein [Acidimicrobiia bacterium]
MTRSLRPSRRERRSPVEETGFTWERRRTRMILPVLLVVAVLSAVVLGFVSPIRQLLAQERRIDETQSKADELDAKNQRLNERIDQLQRDTVVEQIAREELGLVMPGEEAYVLVPAPPTTAAPPTTKPKPDLAVAPTTIAPPTTAAPQLAPVTAPDPSMAKYQDLDPG